MRLTPEGGGAGFVVWRLDGGVSVLVLLVITSWDCESVFATQVVPFGMPECADVVAVEEVFLRNEMTFGQEKGNCQARLTSYTAAPVSSHLGHPRPSNHC